MIDLQELQKLAEAASNLFPDKWEENDEEVVSGGLTISCVNGPYCDPHIGAKSIAKYQAFASPGNIIELIDRLEAAEKVCEAAKNIVDEYYCDEDCCDTGKVLAPLSRAIYKKETGWQKGKEKCVS